MQILPNFTYTEVDACSSLGGVPALASTLAPGCRQLVLRHSVGAGDVIAGCLDTLENCSRTFSSKCRVLNLKVAASGMTVLADPAPTDTRNRRSCRLIAETGCSGEPNRRVIGPETELCSLLDTCLPRLPLLQEIAIEKVRLFFTVCRKQRIR